MLYGVPFEIYSDHRNLHYLFSQKNPSQRLLRLCEFLSGFNFKEVQYVKGEHAAVPDFFSRSSALHALSRMANVGEGKSSNRVRVLPVCAGHIGVVQSRGSDGVQKKFFYQKWYQRAHLRSRSCGICYWGWRVLVRVRHACAVCLMVQMARNGDPITTMRRSWVWSRLDRRVRGFHGCV